MLWDLSGPVGELGWPRPASGNRRVDLIHLPSTASLSLPFQLSGLFRLDDSYETSTSGQEKGESIRGEKKGCQKKDT